jgi:hypothetical protein
MKTHVSLFCFVLLVVALNACGTAGTPYDPGLAARDAQDQAERLAAIATSSAQAAYLTAQAPIIAITEQAGQLNLSMTQNSINKTEIAALWTPTNTPIPTITPPPTANITATLQWNDAQNKIIQDQQRIEREGIVNTIKAIFWWGAGIVALLLIVAAAYPLIKRLAIIPQPIHESGKVYPMVNVIELVAADSDRMPNGIAQLSEKYLKRLPDITAERQADVTAMAQRVDLATRAKLPMSLLKKIDELEQRETPVLPAPDLDEVIPLEYPLPDWSEWMTKWTRGHLALGINEKGLLQTDPDSNPHILFAGTTGSWKTRGGMRVVVACALASGWQVVIAGKELDYKVFSQHPNAYLVPFSLIKDPTKAIDLLRAVYGEIEQRDKMMVRANYNLWRETGQGRTMIVIDEFSNLADALEDIDKARREELWRWARMDTAEARKYGIHMVYALQDPTAKSIDLRIRRNTTPVMFRVKDAASSRTLLNVSGAEELAPRHFLANIVKIESGAAFAPSDIEILQFLNLHWVEQAEPPEWMEGVLVSGELQNSKQDLIEGPAQSSEKLSPLETFAKSLSDEDQKIIDLHVEGKNLSQICKTLYGKSASGSIYYKVTDLIRRYDAVRTSTSTATTPNLSASPA